ncbi:MAG TPA: hypothetical protein VG651_00380 [Stellaceae bacterium]|nr:hypothetical protein [Stellaceae bacterium]
MSAKPLFTYDNDYEPGGTFDLDRASRLIIDDDSWLPALREMISEGLIHVRHSESGVGLGPSDIAAAVALRGLWASGIRDATGLHAASAALYGWQPEQRASEIHPISFALWNADQQAWVLNLSKLWLRRDTGQEQSRAWCFRMADPVMPVNNAKWCLISDLTVYLSPMLQPICRRLKAARVPVPEGARH